MIYSELNIPQVPKSLVCCDPNEVRERYPNIWREVPTTVYTQHIVSDELTNFLKPYLGDDVVVRYQVIEKDIPIHCDYGRTSAINYLLYEGGDEVITRWYEDDKTTQKYQMRIPEFKWHKIDKSIYHGVHGINDKRLALTVSLYNNV